MKKGYFYFIKVYVLWEVMLFYVEELNFKGLLKVQRVRVYDSVCWVEGVLI